MTQILLAFDESGDLTERYLHGPAVDQVLASEEVTSPMTAGDVLWALTDHLGSVRDIAEYDSSTDTTTVVNHLTYDAFGNITGETNASVDFLFAYTGRERDAESDLQYNRARYYDAVAGRWISKDPIGFEAGDANLYRYVENGTTTLTDSSGLSPHQRGARHPETIVNFVRELERRNPTMSPGEILELFQNLMVGQWAGKAIPFVADLGLADTTKKGQCAWVYVFTEDHQWIDMGHFLTMARAGLRFPNQTLLIELLGQAYEDASVELGEKNPDRTGLGSSANTPEDAISNKLGVTFGANLDPNTPLSTQLEEFFASVNAKRFNEAWNYVILPPNEIVWERCWRANGDKAMRRIRAIMDPNHPFWKEHSPTDPDILARIMRGEVWGPIAFPDAYRRH